MKLFKIIYNLFFIGIGIITVLLIVSVFPITGNYKIYVVKSGSMSPAIKTGSVVVAKPAESYKVGDIITFSGAGGNKTPISHRVFAVNDDNGSLTYVTKGDANNTPDSQAVRPSEIIGKIYLSVPYIGYGVATAKTPWGFAFIIGLPALIIILDEIKKIYLEIRKMINKKKQKFKKPRELVVNLKNS